MKVFSAVGLVLMLCLHDGAEACQPYPPSVHYASKASFAAIGHVLDYREDGVELRVSVQVGEVLVGKSALKLEAVSPCHLPVERGERVVVARIGEWLLVYPAEMYEESFLEAFAANR